jgi:hypothetical protein
MEAREHRTVHEREGETDRWSTVSRKRGEKHNTGVERGAKWLSK